MTDLHTDGMSLTVHWRETRFGAVSETWKNVSGLKIEDKFLIFYEQGSLRQHGVYIPTIQKFVYGVEEPV